MLLVWCSEYVLERVHLHLMYELGFAHLLVNNNKTGDELHHSILKPKTGPPDDPCYNVAGIIDFCGWLRPATIDSAKYS